MKLLPLSALAIAVLGAAAATHSRPSVTPGICGLDPETATSTWCSPLIPTPDLRDVRATLELAPVPTPFGAAVTPDGRTRNRLSILAEGLPAARLLGDYDAYVAWATDLTFGEFRRLGTIGNGRSELGELAANQYRILVSAERKPDGERREGRVVLRGTSPSVRLLGHRDVLLSSAGALGRAAPGHDGHEHAATASDGWIAPPMDATMPMMPGMHGRVPAVEPFVAGADRDAASIPFVRPRSLHRLQSGDTLDLTARAVRRRLGARTRIMYGFNGEHPGPLIQVTQGATILVRFRNELELPSAVHWHGVRLDNRFDGAVGVTQDAVAPGGTFEYRVFFRDAGIYWYHPHVREDIQQDLGLYGNLLVSEADSGRYAPVNREEVVTLDDFLVTPETPVQYGLEATTHALTGRFGNVFLTNGEPVYSLTVRRGEVVRFYLTNVASARIFNVSFAGAGMKVVGSDLGRFEREEFAESAVLAPAERYIVDVLFESAGSVPLLNRIQAVDHMLGTYRAQTDTLGWIRVLDEPTQVDHGTAFAEPRRHEDVSRGIAPLRAEFARPVDHELHLRMRAHGLPAGLLSTMGMSYAPPFDFNDGMPMMNWLLTPRDVVWSLFDPLTGYENMDVAWRFRVGQVVKLRLVNNADAFHAMSHPIHIHGQRFLVLRRNGLDNTNLAWKDTVLVGVGETVDVLLEISNPGRWMLHCHIAEHLGAGMHTVFTVES